MQGLAVSTSEINDYDGVIQGSDENSRRYSAHRHVAGLLRPHRWLVALLAAISVLAASCESAVLVLVAEIAGALVERQKQTSVSAGPVHLNTSIDQMLVLGAVLALGRIVLQVLVAYLPARILADTQTSMRDSLASAYFNSSWPVKATEPEGTLQELLTGQVIQATAVVHITLTMVSTFVTLTILVASALTVGLIPALAVLVAGMALFVSLRPLAHLGSRRAEGLADSQMLYADSVSESGRLAQEAQVFGVGESVQNRLVGMAQAIRGRYLMTTFLGALAPGVYYGLILLLLLGGLAALAATESGRAVSLGASVLLLVRAANYGQMVQGQYQTWKQHAPFLARLGEAELRYHSSDMRRGTAEIHRTPALLFEDVTYSYGRGEPALKGVSFEIEPGEAIGIVGPTGAGKSTLVQLLLGLREPTAGTYFIDGMRSEAYPLASFARAFAYVPQEPRLLHATVAENIAFYRPIEHDLVRRAAKLSAIDRDILSWPHQYDTVIGQRADAVSGGQRQRLCLARALAGQPSVLILDEPTSSLDPRSEALVMESLTALKGQMTILLVAHHLSALTFCDRILVLVGGTVQALDSPSNLMSKDGFYRQAFALPQHH